MAFTITTSTLGGVAARLVTGTGDLDDLATALSTHGVTKTENTFTFAGTGADTYYALDGTLTEERDGIWTILVSTQSFLCLSRLSSAVTTLGKVTSTGAISSRVDIRYLESCFGQSADPFQSAAYKCHAGAGTLNFVAGSINTDCSSRSDLDVWQSATAVTYDAVQLGLNYTSTASYSHIFTNANVTTTSNTSFLYHSSKYLEAAVHGYRPSIAWNVTIDSLFVNTGLRIIDMGALTAYTVNQAQYDILDSNNSLSGSTINSVDPSQTHQSNVFGSPTITTISRTINATFKDTLAANITSPDPTLVKVNPDTTTATAAFSAGAATITATQSTSIANTQYYSNGTGWTDAGTYDFYAVGFGYAAQYTSVNLKTAHLGNAGIPWAAVSVKSALVTTAYASVVTAGFALTTGTDTLAITTSRTTSQSAEYLFKHAYDNPADSYWRTRLHTPATQNASGYIDFAATNITVTGVALSGTAFSTTGTITLASSATCSAPIVKSSGVISSGDIDNVTGLVTLTGTARWDITTGGTAPAGTAAAGNTIRVTTAAAAADFNFTAFTFNASTTFENTSGNNITVTLSTGQTQPTKLETSGTITFVTPAILQSVTITGVVAGSRVQIYDTTNSVELFNGTSSYSWTDSVTAAGNRAIRVRIAKVSGTTAYTFIDANIGTCGTTDGTKAVTYLATQELDTTYNSNAVDGPAIYATSGITFTDASPDRVNCNITGGAVTYPTIYACFVYWTFTSTGIANDFTYIDAPDTANYLLSGMKIRNTSATDLVVTGGYGRDATSGLSRDIIDTAGSTGNIFLAPDHVTPYATGSGVTPSDVSDIASAVLNAAATTPIAANIEKVNNQTISGTGTAVDPWGP